MLWSYHYKPWQTVISFSVIVLWSPHIWQVVIWCFSPTSSIYVIPRMDLIHQDVMYVQVFPVAHLTCVPDKLISITDRALSWKAAGFACIHIQMHTCIHACTRIYDTHVHTYMIHTYTHIWYTRTHIYDTHVHTYMVHMYTHIWYTRTHTRTSSFTICAHALTIYTNTVQ